MKSRLLDLIQRIEKCVGPDREVDYVVAEVVWPGCGLAPHVVGEEPIMWHAPHPWYKRVAPQFTASLDAAMGVFEDGLIVRLLLYAGHPATVTVERSDGFSIKPVASVQAPTAPLALLLAALRARLQED